VVVGGQKKEIGLIGRIWPMGLIEYWVGGDGSLTGVRDDMGAEFGLTRS